MTAYASNPINQSAVRGRSINQQSGADLGGGGGVEAKHPESKN